MIFQLCGNWLSLWDALLSKFAMRIVYVVVLRRTVELLLFADRRRLGAGCGVADCSERRSCICFFNRFSVCALAFFWRSMCAFLDFLLSSVFSFSTCSNFRLLDSRPVCGAVGWGGNLLGFVRPANHNGHFRTEKSSPKPSVIATGVQTC